MRSFFFVLILFLYFYAFPFSSNAASQSGISPDHTTVTHDGSIYNVLIYWGTVRMQYMGPVYCKPDGLGYRIGFNPDPYDVVGFSYYHDVVNTGPIIGPAFPDADGDGIEDQYDPCPDTPNSDVTVKPYHNNCHEELSFLEVTGYAADGSECGGTYRYELDDSTMNSTVRNSDQITADANAGCYQAGEPYNMTAAGYQGSQSAGTTPSENATNGFMSWHSSSSSSNSTGGGNSTGSTNSTGSGDGNSTGSGSGDGNSTGSGTGTSNSTGSGSSNSTGGNSTYGTPIAFKYSSNSTSFYNLDQENQRATTAKSELLQKWHQLKSRFDSILDVNLSGSSQLPTWHWNILGNTIDIDLGQFADALSYIGLAIIFIATLKALFIVFG